MSSNIRYLNKKSKAYHNILQASEAPLLIVQCAMGEMLMTTQAFEALLAVLDECDRQSAQSVFIMPESAARLGYSHCWTRDEVQKLWGSDNSGA